MSAAVNVLAARAVEILAEKCSDGSPIDRENLALRIARMEQRDTAAAELGALVRPRVAMTFEEGRAAEDRGQDLIYCQFDALNPCWEPVATAYRVDGWSREHGPGKHWGGDDACDGCRLRAALARIGGEA